MGAVADLQDLLQSESLVDGATGWVSKRRRETDEDEDQVILTEDGGGGPEMPADQGIGDEAQGDPAVQVRARGSTAWNADATAATVQEIIDAIHGKLAVTVNGTRYHRIRAQTQEPVFAGYDDDGRPSHTASFLMLRDA